MELCIGAWLDGCMRNDSKRLLISIHTAATKFITCNEEFVEPVLERLNALLCGHAVVEADYDSNNFYIGYGATCDDFEETKTPLIPNDDILYALATTLGEFGVWEQCEDSFGLWTISSGH